MRRSFATRLVVLVAVLFGVWAAPALAADHTVTNTSDSGAGSLRQAITDANADTTTPDRVVFAIAGSGPYTIAITSAALPQITKPVTIDATTQTGWVGPPIVEVKGSALASSTGADGLFLGTGSSHSTVKGLVIDGFPVDGIRIHSDGNTITGNYIGTDPTGGIAAGNKSDGVQVEIGASNVIDGNVISGNTSAEVYISAGIGTGNDGNTISNNFIGTNSDGSAAVAGNNRGVDIVGGSNAVLRGNVIAANKPNVNLWSTGSKTLIAGNTIGLNKAGTAPLGGSGGVIVNTANNTIGGTTSADRNVIAGTNGPNVSLDGTGATGNVVEGNYIGTKADGTTDSTISATQNVGVWVRNSAKNNTIGGTTSGAGNIIAGSIGGGPDGVLVEDGSTGNSIIGNSIFGNAFGIDLRTATDAVGSTANDAGDADTGGNDLQNFPVITNYTTTSGQTTITGTLDTQPGTYTIEFFTNAACDSSGYGQGETSLGRIDGLATDSSGHAALSFTTPIAIKAGGVTATATSSSGDTSEFSACYPASTGGGGTTTGSTSTSTTTATTATTTTTGSTTTATTATTTTTTPTTTTVPVSGDGSGTVTTPLAPVTAGSAGNTITFTYTAATGGMSGGELDITAPSGWSGPSTASGDAGYTTASTGTVAVSGQTIRVTGITLDGGATMTVTYANATAPTTVGAQAWTTQEKSTAAGTLTSIAAPSVAVTAAAAGADSLTLASPVSVAAGGSALMTGSALHLNALPGKADIEIAIDTTGSMTPSLVQAKRDATDIVNSVQASIADTQFAVVAFKDNVDGSAEYAVSHALTAQAADVQSAINALSAGGGGDNPEAYNLVFHNSYSPDVAGDIGWRTGSRKIVVVIGDAEPHGAGTAGLSGCADTSADPHGYNTATELAGMKTAQRTLFMIRQVASTTTTSLACYQSLAASAYTGGAGVDSGSSLGAQIVGLVQSAAAHVGQVTFTTSTSGFTYTPSASAPLSNFTTPTVTTIDGTLAAGATVAPGSYTVTVSAYSDGVLRASGTTTVTVKAPISNLALSVTPASVGAGIDQLTLGQIPGSALAFYAGVPDTAPVSSVPFGGTPFGGTPLGGTPYGGTPFGGTPYGGTPFGGTGLLDIPYGGTPYGGTSLGTSPLGSLLLSQIQLCGDVPLVGTTQAQCVADGATWSAVLGDAVSSTGQRFADLPLTTMTLGDVTANAAVKARLAALPMRDISLGTTLLKNVHTLSLLIGSAPLESIAPPTGYDSWCLGAHPALPDFGGTCTNVTSSTTVIQADVAGQIGSAPFGGTPFGGTPFGGTPFGGTPFGGTPMGGTTLVSSTIAISRVAAIPLADINPITDVVDCSKLAGGTCAGKTLGDAAAATGAILPTVTWSNPTLDAALQADGITYNDILIAILGAVGLPWENLPVQGLQPYATTKTQVTYQVSLAVDCSVVDNGFAPSVQLPDGFFPAAGTSTVSFGGAAASTAPDPSRSGATAGEAAKLNTYVWSLTCPNTTASTATLTFKSWVGLTLGKQTASATASAGAFSIGGASAAVTVGQNFEPNDDMNSAVTIQPDTLVAGHIAFSGDQDFFQLKLDGLARGTKIAVSLKVPTGADFDLALTRPAMQGFFSTPNPSSPLATVPLQDGGAGLAANGPLPSEGLQDIPFGGTPFGGTPFGGTPFGGTPFGGTPFGGTSTNRGDANEAIQIVTTGETGYVTIDVTGYNGSTSASPYVLRVHETPPPSLPTSCPVRVFPSGQPATFPAGTLPATLPSTTKSIFIIDSQQMSGLYGSAKTSALLQQLTSFATRAEVSGTVLDVSGNLAVRNAYAAWNANPCDIDLRNTVVRSINDVVSGYRNTSTGLPNLHYVVLDGNDDATPMAATTDPVSLSPEVDEATDLAFTTTNLTADNALYSAEAQNYLLTDGAYGAFTSIPWLGHDLLLPQVSVSRLVETPDDIMGQLTRYLKSSGYTGTPQSGVGTLSPQTILPMGYDFLADGAEKVRDNLHLNFPGATIQSTVGPNGDLAINDPAVSPIPLPWNANDVITSFLAAAAPADIASLNAHYNHWELEAADFATAAKTSDAAAALASRILFTMGCHGGLNVADTLVPALAGDPRVLDWPQLYSQKQVAVYIANTGFGYGDTDSVALSERILSLFAQNLHSDGNSVGEEWAQTQQQYFATVGVYDVFDEKVLEETTFYGLPFWHFGTAGTTAPAPTALTTSADAATGTQSATIAFPGTGATTQTQFGLYRPTLPITSQEVTSSSLPARGLWIKSLQTNDTSVGGATIGFPTVDLSAHEHATGINGIFFPANPFMLEHTNTFGKERDYVDVSSQFRPDGSTSGAGTQRDVAAATLQVFYSNRADRTPPLISQVNVSMSGLTATVQARVTDDSGVVPEAAALVNDGTWHYVQLAVSAQDPTLWSGTVTVTKEPEVFVEATDGANVGYSANKGSNFTSANSGTPNGAQILLQAPTGPYGPSQVVNATFQCLVDGSPLPSSQCTGTTANGAPIDTTTFGPHTFLVRAFDSSGAVIGSLQRVYWVVYTFKGFFQPVDNEPTLNVVKAGSGVPVKFGLSGNQGLDVFASDANGSYPRSQTIACDASAPADGLVATVTAGGSTLSYDATADQYTYVWKTDSSWSGSCRALIVKTKDGVVHRADFKFTK